VFPSKTPAASDHSLNHEPPAMNQRRQAMAGFGGGSGAAGSLNTTALSSDTSQQTFLTTPQHG